MSRLDDRLRRDLERLAESAETGRGVFGRVQAKKARRRWIRRTQVAGLVVAVVSGTAAGTYGLSRMFEAADTSKVGRTAPLAGNGLIAFARDGRLYVMDPDGADVRRVPTAEGAGEGEGTFARFPAWSPEGKRIAFVTEDSDGGNRRIEVVEVATGEVVAALAPKGTSEVRFVEYSRPSWSPDGTRLAFSAAQMPTRGCDQGGCPGEGRSYVFSGRTDGKGVVQLTHGDVMDFFPTWSPDGTTIAFTRGLPGVGNSASGRTIQLMKADGSNVRTVRTGLGTPLQLAWSPDGGEIAVIDSSGDLSVLQGVAGGAVTPLLDAKAHFAGILDVGWSPDGKTIVYWQHEGAEGAIYVVSADGGRPERLVEGCCPSWQPLPIGAPPIAPTPTGPRLPNSTTHAPPPMSPPSAPPTMTPPIIPPPRPLELAPECGGSTIVAEFDGNRSGHPDQKLDRATVARSSCLYEPSNPDVAPNDAPGFAIDVEWGSGASGIWPLPACDPPSNACRISGAKDIDGDGLAELAITVHEGASTSFVELYRLPTWEPGSIRFIVAPPGDPPAFAPGEEARFAQGGTVTHRDLLACSTAPDGTAEISAISAEVSEDQMNWIVHETTFKVEEEAFRVTAVDEYETPVNPLGLSPLGRSPCFGDSTTEP